jgi:hypothetical protein
MKRNKTLIKHFNYFQIHKQLQEAQSTGASSKSDRISVGQAAFGALCQLVGQMQGSLGERADALDAFNDGYGRLHKELGEIEQQLNATNKLGRQALPNARKTYDALKVDLRISKTIKIIILSEYRNAIKHCAAKSTGFNQHRPTTARFKVVT